MKQTSSMLWRRLDQPGHESSRLAHEQGRIVLSGTAVFGHQQQTCRLDYTVACDPEWHTLSAKVAGWLGDATVVVEVGVDVQQRWTLNGIECPQVAGCQDIDLSFSPSTNLLPIRRLALRVGERANVRAAWLRFPTFSLEPLDQVYEHFGDDRYRYESAGGAFITVLQVNSVGFVTNYPGLWQQELAG